MNEFYILQMTSDEPILVYNIHTKTGYVINNVDNVNNS